jgi:hypothetical protein
MNNDPKTIIQALHVENRQLRQQVAALAERRSSQNLFEKLLCAGLTATLMRAESPKIAAEMAIQAADQVAAMLNAPQQEPITDPEMNQRP